MTIPEWHSCNHTEQETVLQSDLWTRAAVQGCSEVTTTVKLDDTDADAGASDIDERKRVQCEVSEEGSVRSISATEELPVRWMTTGDLVCTVPCRPQDCITEVKKHVQEQTDIPAKELRLFAGDDELSTDAILPNACTSCGLMLVRSAAPENTLPHGCASCGLLLVRSVTDPRVTNLGHFHRSTQYKSAPHGNFKRISRVAQGIHGDIFKYCWNRGETEELVAVKQLRNQPLKRDQTAEMDDRVFHLEPWRSAPFEDALAELGILSYLSEQADAPRYILPMLEIFSDAHVTWLVLEFADGGELFDVAAAGLVAEKESRRYMWQLLQAVAYLHKHRIGHRDISLENVLLKGGEVRLMDFGMAVKSHSASGTPLRFFRFVGKDFYRGPECYVPKAEQVRILAPSNATPGAVMMVRTSAGYLCEVRMPSDVLPGRMCEAEVWGWAAQPNDVFSTGICTFIMGKQIPPWHCARLDDPAFAHKHNHGDEGLAGVLHLFRMTPMSPEAMKLVSSMLRSDPAQRPSALECLASPWFAQDAELQNLSHSC